MQLDELITKVGRLPPSRQQEVLDFVAFLEQRYGIDSSTGHENWSDENFELMGLEQAMRGLEEEPELYSEKDLKERWQ